MERFDKVPNIHQVFLLALCTVATALNANPKRQHKAHVHGKGELDLVVEGDRIAINLSIPMESLTGFERAPSTAEEKKTLEQAEATLKNTGDILEINGAAECNFEVPQINQASDKHKHKHDSDHNHKNQADTEHIEFKVSYKASCAKIDKLEFIKLLLFDKFSNISEIKAEVLIKNTPRVKILKKFASELSLR